MWDACGVYKVFVMFTTFYVLYYVLQNVSFFCSFVTFLDVISGRDIKFCSNCGMSAGDAFSSNMLT